MKEEKTNVEKPQGLLRELAPWKKELLGRILFEEVKKEVESATPNAD